jgi:hypothetical protein
MKYVIQLFPQSRFFWNRDMGWGSRSAASTIECTCEKEVEKLRTEAYQLGVEAMVRPITAPEAASPAEESKVDELIREAEAAITGGVSVARPLPILIAKLLRELKGRVD